MVGSIRSLRRRPEPRERPLLVGAGELGEAHYVHREDGCQLALDLRRGQGRILLFGTMHTIEGLLMKLRRALQPRSVSDRAYSAHSPTMNGAERIFTTT